jgi:hypothetical protein
VHDDDVDVARAQAARVAGLVRPRRA